jgi:hypothetical protein
VVFYEADAANQMPTVTAPHHFLGWLTVKAEVARKLPFKVIWQLVGRGLDWTLTSWTFRLWKLGDASFAQEMLALETFQELTFLHANGALLADKAAHLFRDGWDRSKCHFNFFPGFVYSISKKKDPAESPQCWMSVTMDTNSF